MLALDMTGNSPEEKRQIGVGHVEAAQNLAIACGRDACPTPALSRRVCQGTVRPVGWPAHSLVRSQW